MKIRNFPLVCYLVCIISLNTQAQNKTDLPVGFEQYMDSILTVFNVPGISLAIVKDGNILKAGGYGVKKLGEHNPVDAHTLFSIASNTKAFTAAALEILVEDKKLKWDDPVINYLPWFKMSDPWVTAEFSVRDLLVHHSGIPGFAGDILIFPPSEYSRKEIVSKLKLIPLVHSFRTTYAYDNILYLAAGELIKSVSGMEWEDFVKQRIFDQLGMAESISRFSDFKTQNNIASAHSPVLGKIEVDNAFFDQAVGDAGNPAGGIASNAVDMSKWLIAQLDSGRGNNGKSIFQPKAIKELWRMVTPTPITKTPIEIWPSQTNFSGYALGVKTYQYGKYELIGHGGKLDGFVSQVVLVPALKLGIAVLTNQESTGAYWAVIYHLLDFYMQNPKFNWIEGYKKLLDSSIEKSKKEYAQSIIPKKVNIIMNINDSQIIGNYHDAFYGDASIVKQGSKLILQFSQTPQFVADLIPFQYQSYYAKFRNTTLRADAYVSFSLSPDGKVAQFQIRIIDPDSDINFDELLFKPVKNK